MHNRSVSEYTSEGFHATQHPSYIDIGKPKFAVSLPRPRSASNHCCPDEEHSDDDAYYHSWDGTYCGALGPVGRLSEHCNTDDPCGKKYGQEGQIHSPKTMRNRLLETDFDFRPTVILAQFTSPFRIVDADRRVECVRKDVLIERIHR